MRRVFLLCLALLVGIAPAGADDVDEYEVERAMATGTTNRGVNDFMRARPNVRINTWPILGLIRAFLP